MAKFSQKFLNQVKGGLEKLRQSLLQKRQRLISEDPYFEPDRLVANAPDDDSRESEGHTRVEAFVGEVDQRLENVDKAIGQVDKGIWGNCEKCGRKIDAKRLSLVPWTTLCSRCEELVESEKRAGI